MTTEPLTSVLAFGAGVQSTALLLLTLYRDVRLLQAVKSLPTFAVFADPGSEGHKTYAHVEWCKTQCAEQSYPLYVARVPPEWNQRTTLAENITNPITARTSDKRRISSIPAFTAPKPGGRGRGGMLQRNCTGDYKIRVVAHQIREHIGRRLSFARGDLVDVWLGISTDEIQRMKPETRIRWQRRVFPLIEMGWSRQDCIDYLTSLGLGDVPKSACVFCPYHDNEAWEHLYITDLAGFKEAVKVDEALRTLDGAGGVTDTPYLHPSHKPLASLPFRTKEGGPDHWDNECEGYCGL